MSVCGLFSDPNETYYKSKAYYGDENLWKESKQEKTTPLIEEKE